MKLKRDVFRERPKKKIGKREKSYQNVRVNTLLKGMKPLMSSTPLGKVTNDDMPISLPTKQHLPIKSVQMTLSPIAPASERPTIYQNY